MVRATPLLRGVQLSHNVPPHFLFVSHPSPSPKYLDTHLQHPILSVTLTKLSHSSSLSQYFTSFIFIILCHPSTSTLSHPSPSSYFALNPNRTTSSFILTELSHASSSLIYYILHPQHAVPSIILTNLILHPHQTISPFTLTYLILHPHQTISPFTLTYLTIHPHQTISPFTLTHLIHPPHQTISPFTLTYLTIHPHQTISPFTLIYLALHSDQTVPSFITSDYFNIHSITPAHL